MSAPLLPPTKRILAVDATRGLAMCFVALSHFSWTLEKTQASLATILESVAMIASPTFLLLSGAMLGLLQLRRRDNLPDLASRLFHRGLFVLVVGHLLISGASALTHSQPYLSVMLDRVYITDVVGICLMLLPRLTTGWSVRRLVGTGIALFLVALLISFVWQPAHTTGIVIEQMLFGSRGHPGRQLMEYASPILPYVGVYMAGIGLGSYIERVGRGGLEARESWRIVGIAVAMVFVAVCAKGGWVLSHWEATPGAGAIVHQLTSPLQKLPPGPTYLLTFAGLGMLALSAIIWLERRSPSSPALHGLAVIGQCSFFVFIVQFYIFGPMSDFPEIFGGRFWWLSYGCALAVIWCLALLWRKVRGNRLFDITYTLTHARDANLPKPADGTVS